ncbi:MAG: hypothetical protein L0241_21270 [Planctomycetia bacterium]|nr:hypothetical protein [Planctomycetia bacterium]
MSVRVSALAVFVLLELASFAPISAQPQPPIRPRYTQFQNMFRPGVPPQPNPGQGILGQRLPMGNPGGPQAPGFVYPQAQAAPLPPGVDPFLPPTGVVGRFNDLGHWYGGNYGTWYPNGVANGNGVLGPTVGFPPSMGGFPTRRGGSVISTAAGIGATVGTFRR